MKTIILFALLILSACSTAKQADEKGLMTPKRSYQVESFTRTDKLQGTYRITYDENDTSLVRSMEKVEKLLKMAGLTPKSDGAVDYNVNVTFELETPFAGVAMGFINPYKHTVILRGNTGKRLVWETKVSGPSEEKDRTDVLPSLLAVARPWLGKNTKQTIAFSPNDPAVKDFADAQ